METFRERGFVAPGAPVPAARRRPPGSGPSRMLSAAFTILGTSRRLKRQGLWSAYADTLRLDPGRDPGKIASCLNAFVSAENFTPLRQAPKDCLPRSLALYRFLLACGIPVEHVIGVQSHPFLAHAWVEKDGSALLEAKAQNFRPIARMMPAE